MTAGADEGTTAGPPGPVLRVAASYVRVMDRVSEFFGEIAKYLVIVVVVVGFLNVVLRYVGRATERRLTSNVFIEAQWYLYGIIFLLGFAYILKNHINVRVDFWYAGWPKKRRAWIDFVGHTVALIPFCILALYVLWGPTLRSFGQRPDGSWPTLRVWEIWEQSPDPSGLPRAPIRAVIVLGFLLLLLQALAEMVKLWAIITDREHQLAIQVTEVEEPLRIE
jgi:TRAP-type mannitol/chloroaromatic compound transport system permease small subunit